MSCEGLFTTLLLFKTPMASINQEKLPEDGVPSARYIASIFPISPGHKEQGKPRNWPRLKVTQETHSLQQHELLDWTVEQKGGYGGISREI